MNYPIRRFVVALLLLVSLAATAAAQTNDNFADRLTLSGAVVSTTGNNATATAETGEPAHAGNTAVKSLWWQWRATAFGRLTVSTAGSNFDTTLGIYTGTGVANLTEIGSSDQTNTDSTSLTTVFVAPGMTYYIAVDGYLGATGKASLTLSFVPSNDLYSTDFEAFPTGADNVPAYDSWLATNVTDNVTSIVSDSSGKSARIGGSTTVQDLATYTWRPLNYDPIAAGTPLVRFTTDVTIVDSTNGKRDSFVFLLFNGAGQPICGLTFDNSTQRLYSYDGVDFAYVGTFVFGTKYALVMTFNFATKQFSASVSGRNLFSNLAMKLSEKPLSLGDIDVAWFPATKGSPGDNYMSFDNFRVGLLEPAPVIVTPPAAISVAKGASALLSVGANGFDLTYQWSKDGVVIPGATSASYTLTNASAANAGDYTVTVTSPYSSTVSPAGRVTVLDTTDVGRLLNLSVRTHAGSGGTSLLTGFVTGGTGTSGTKPLLIRAVGPTLATYGVGGTLSNPSIQVIDQGNGSIFAANDDWAGDTQVTNVGNAVGAFPLMSTTSKDAALYSAPAKGTFAVKVLGGTGTSDITLAEIYDATPSSAFTVTTPRLINVSARAQVDTGDGILICGFVIGGSTSRTIMIRGIGPTLTGYGVPGALANPKLLLYQKINGVDTLIATNDDWGQALNASTVVTTASQVGAFSLTAGSKDAVLLMTLAPGVYSAQLSGVNETTGVGLVEVYDAP